MSNFFLNLLKYLKKIFKPLLFALYLNILFVFIMILMLYISGISINQWLAILPFEDNPNQMSLLIKSAWIIFFSILQVIHTLNSVLDLYIFSLMSINIPTHHPTNLCPPPSFRIAGDGSHSGAGDEVAKELSPEETEDLIKAFQKNYPFISTFCKKKFKSSCELIILPPKFRYLWTHELVIWVFINIICMIIWVILIILWFWLNY